MGLILAVFPLCLTRKFLRLKMLAYLIIALIALFYVVITLMIFQVKPGYYQIENDIF
jgi:amino acid permease